MACSHLCLLQEAHVRPLGFVQSLMVNFKLQSLQGTTVLMWLGWQVHEDNHYSVAADTTRLPTAAAWGL